MVGEWWEDILRKNLGPPELNLYTPRVSIAFPQSLLDAAISSCRYTTTPSVRSIFGNNHMQLLRLLWFVKYNESRDSATCALHSGERKTSESVLLLLLSSRCASSPKLYIHGRSRHCRHKTPRQTWSRQVVWGNEISNVEGATSAVKKTSAVKDVMIRTRMRGLCDYKRNNDREFPKNTGRGQNQTILTPRLQYWGSFQNGMKGTL